MPPKFSDPASTPRFPYRGEARREKPIYTRHQFGPWQCDVAVTPITGLRAGYAVFEVSCSWQHGPALDDSLGAAPPTGMAGVDTYYIDRQARDLQLTAQQAQEFAVELAKRAGDLLAEAVKPDLRALARHMQSRLK